MPRRLRLLVETHYASIGYALLACGLVLAFLVSNAAHNEAQRANRALVKEAQQRAEDNRRLLDSRAEALCDVQVGVYAALRDLLEGLTVVSQSPAMLRFQQEELRRLEAHKPMCAPVPPALPPPQIPPPSTTPTTVVSRSSVPFGSGTIFFVITRPIINEVTGPPNTRRVTTTTTTPCVTHGNSPKCHPIKEKKK